MAKNSKISQFTPYPVAQVLVSIGRNIKTARLRRGLRLQDVAERVGISRYVMSDIEKGKPSTAIAAYIGALWALRLTNGLLTIADPDADREGKAYEASRAPTTARKRKEVIDNDF